MSDAEHARLPVWSITTVRYRSAAQALRDGPAELSFDPGPEHDLDLRFGAPLVGTPPAEVEMYTYAEREQAELPDDERTMTADELRRVSLAGEPIEYYDSACVWSQRLVDVTRAAGATNLETWPIRLVHRASDRHWDHVLVNVLGLTQARALARSELAIARDDESLTLLLTDPIKRAWESLGLDYLDFMKRHPALP